MSVCDIQKINNILNLNFDNCYKNKLSEHELISRIEKEISNNQLEYILTEIQTQLSNKNNYKIENTLKRLYKSLNKLFNYLFKYRINTIYCDCDDYYDDYSDDNEYMSETECYYKYQSNFINNPDKFTCRLCQIINLLNDYKNKVWNIYCSYIIHTNNIVRIIRTDI